MKRLYQITDLTTRKAVPDEFFSDKQKAKTRRRELNGDETELAPNQFRFVVSPGPDHHNYKG